MSHNTGMQEEMLPLFPLETVLLPHCELRLHIFEERYKEMIGECLQSGQEFGVVQARGGGLLRIGCTASIEEVLRRYEDGRMDILTVGRRRFALQEVFPGRSYLRGKAVFFGDRDEAAPDRRLVREALAAWLEVIRVKEEEAEAPDIDHPQLSFLLCDISPDLHFRQRLLEMQSERERLEAAIAHLKRLAEKERIRRAMEKVVRSNGHGRHLYSPQE
ncbi:MAG: LON peptidase substrate-binding domain-containing protein [Bryobacteraceae bacterium]|nr:LON peptidase substrate-binding domain-containing protein [Bryobacteraceae bacterium]